MAVEPIVVGGVAYVTTTQASELLAGEPDEYRTAAEYAAEVQRWSDRIGFWLASSSVALDVVRDQAGRPVRLPTAGGKGRANVLRWADVVEVEHATRTCGRGRRRVAA